MQTERTTFRADDVATAHRIEPIHQPYTDAKGVARCGSASHTTGKKGPRWPCLRAAWVRLALAADDAGTVESDAELDG